MIENSTWESHYFWMHKPLFWEIPVVSRQILEVFPKAQTSTQHFSRHEWTTANEVEFTAVSTFAIVYQYFQYSTGNEEDRDDRKIHFHWCRYSS